jgi:hypothetical protein
VSTASDRASVAATAGSEPDRVSATSAQAPSPIATTPQATASAASVGHPGRRAGGSSSAGNGTGLPGEASSISSGESSATS